MVNDNHLRSHFHLSTGSPNESRGFEHALARMTENHRILEKVRDSKVRGYDTWMKHLEESTVSRNEYKHEHAELSTHHSIAEVHERMRHMNEALKRATSSLLTVLWNANHAFEGSLDHRFGRGPSSYCWGSHPLAEEELRHAIGKLIFTIYHRFDLRGASNGSIKVGST